MPALPDLHLEITSKCALACPACPRTFHFGDYKVQDLPMPAIDNIVSSRQSYQGIFLCGDHGDPIYHTQFHSILEKLLKMPGEPFISISTNGSYRSRDWWIKTGQMLRRKDRIIFGVDGLKDTSHLYRRGNNWDSISLAIEALKSVSEVQVRWQWILFSHNENQLELAARQAWEWGVDRFVIVGSSKSIETDRWKPNLTLEQAESRFQRAYDDLSTL